MNWSESEKKAFSEYYKKLNFDEKKLYYERLFADFAHDFVDDFVIAEGTRFHHKIFKAVIAHIPTGLFIGIDIPYHTGLKRLKENNEEQRNELLSLIYGA